MNRLPFVPEVNFVLLEVKMIYINLKIKQIIKMFM